MHSDNTLLANARAIAADWHFDAASVIYTLSPLSHNLGFGAMVSALYRGAEIVLSRLDRVNPWWVTCSGPGLRSSTACRPMPSTCCRNYGNPGPWLPENNGFPHFRRAGAR